MAIPTTTFVRGVPAPGDLVDGQHGDTKVVAVRPARTPAGDGVMGVDQFALADGSVVAVTPDQILSVMSGDAWTNLRASEVGAGVFLRGVEGPIEVIGAERAIEQVACIDVVTEDRSLAVGAVILVTDRKRPGDEPEDE